MAAVTRAERALGRSGRALQGGHDGAHEAECKLENKHPNTQTYDQFLQVAVGIVLLAAVARFRIGKEDQWLRWRNDLKLRILIPIH